MNLTGYLLISTHQLNGSAFADSVVYICRHDKEGAFGIVINKPSKVPVSDLLESLKIDSSSIDKSMVLYGGPAKPEQVFILHTLPANFDVTIKVGQHIGVTLSRDILTAIAENGAPEKMLFALGYAGWDEQQLEEEIKENAWIAVPASTDILFDLPTTTRLHEATRRLGFDINNLSDVTGHA